MDPHSLPRFLSGPFIVWILGTLRGYYRDPFPHSPLRAREKKLRFASKRVSAVEHHVEPSKSVGCGIRASGRISGLGVREPGSRPKESMH